jgi:uncharacterized protein
VILTDAGPLLALIDRRDRHHHRCVTASAGLVGPMLTTWPAFTEAMHLAGREGAWPWQEVMWRWVRAGVLVVLEATPRMTARMPVLMEQYRDLPMDLADASLVTLAEERRLRQIFTLDDNFRVYRLPSGVAFEVVPS